MRSTLLRAGFAVLFGLCMSTAVPASAAGADVGSILPEIAARLLKPIHDLRAYPHLDRAYRLLEQQRLADARHEFELHLALNPTNTEARLAYVVLLYRLKAYSLAIEQGQRVTRQETDAGYGWLYIGMAQQALGTLEPALQSFTRAVTSRELRPDSRVFAYSSVAEIGTKLRRKDDVMSAYTALSRLTPGFDVSFRAGVAFDTIGELPEAERAYRTALRLSRDAAQRKRALLAIGRVAQHQGHWSAARSAYIGALGGTASDPTIYRALGDIAMAGNDYAGAVGWFQQLVRATDNRDAREALGNALFKSGNSAGAAAEFARAAQGAESTADRYRLNMALGQAHLVRGDPRAAAHAFAAAEAAQQTAEAGSARGEALERAGQLEDALAAYRLARKRARTASTSLAVGMLEARLGQHEFAIRDLSTALGGVLPAAEQVLAYRQLGYSLQLAGRRDAARAALEHALRLDPSDGETYAALGENAIATGDRARAIDALVHLVALRPTPSRKRQLADAYADAGRIGDAIGLYRELADTATSRNAAALFTSIGNFEFRRQHYLDAASAFNTAYDRGGAADWQNLVQAAESYAAAEWWDAVEKTSLRLLARPDVPPTAMAAEYERLGMAYTALKRPSEAAAALQRALALGRNTRELRLNLGFALSALGQWREALPEFQAALKLRPDDRVRVSVARAYHALGKPGLALYYLRPVLESPQDIGASERQELTRLSGFLLAAEGEQMAALAALKMSLAVRPDDLNVRIAMSSTLRVLGKPEDAADVITVPQPSSLSSADAGRYLDELAEFLRTKEDFEGAIDAARRALEREPTIARVHRLGVCLSLASRDEEAIPWLERAAADDGADPRILEDLGYAYKRVGRAKDALRTLTRAADDGFSRPWLYEDLGYAALASGRPAEARAWFTKALSMAALYPQETDDDRSALRQRLGALRQQRSQLTGGVSVEAYSSYRSDSAAGELTSASARVPSASSFGGVDLSYRPAPNGRTRLSRAEPFARVLSSPRLASGEAKPFQLSLGIRYKPFALTNLNASVERLIGLDAKTRDTWLVRTLYSWESRPGFIRQTQHEPYTFVFGDAAYFVNANQRLYYAEFRQGVAFNVRNSAVVTPHGVIATRFLSGRNLPEYLEAGAGASIKARVATHSDRPSDVEAVLGYRQRLQSSGRSGGFTLLLLVHH